MTNATAPAAFANQIVGTDVHPFEVVRAVSDKCLEIKRMGALLKDEWEANMIVGGFVGHVINNGGEWVITSSNDGPIIRIRRNIKGQWKDAHGNRYSLSDTPRAYYDFNY